MQQQWRAVTFEYSGPALHAAIVFPSKTDFMANRAATKEAAGPESLKRLEENKGGREKGWGEEKGEDGRKKKEDIWSLLEFLFPEHTQKALFFSLQQKVKASKTFINAVIQAARDGVFSP